MKAIFDCLGCMVFMLGVCTPNDSVSLSSLLLATGGMILFRKDIISWFWKNSSCFKRLFPIGHDSMFLSSETRKGGK